MQPQLISHVSDFSLVIESFFDDLRWRSVVAGEVEACFFQGAFEDFHEAVGVGVVVDWTAFLGGPDEY